MRSRLSYAAWSGFRPVTPATRRGRKPLTPEQAFDLQVERAHRCGFRYFAHGWRRRFPPRFDHLRLRWDHPDQVLRRACRTAFYRGYDDGRTAKRDRDRAWAVDWPLDPPTA